MSVDTDFRALLAGHAALTSLVGTRIAAHAVPQDSAYPLVVFSVQQAPEYGLDNTLHATLITYAVQCFAETAVLADAVADAVAGAIATTTTHLVTDRVGTFEAELGVDVVQLTVTRWIV